MEWLLICVRRCITGERRGAASLPNPVDSLGRVLAASPRQDWMPVSSGWGASGSDAA
jgi:hypothetical protein